MNYRMILYILGWVMTFEGAFLCLPCLVALYYGETSGLAFVATMVCTLAVGLLIIRKKPENTVFYAKEGFVTVSLSWIVLSIIGAVPFLLTGEIASVTDALFEVVSGFTTTGASILADVESLSRCTLFWRSFTHWIGGMGVLVFILAILPMTGGQTVFLMKAESPGPSVSKLVPKVRTTAMILYGIYCLMTALQIVFLLLGKMPFFDAVTTAFGTAGTGGFGIKNDSIAGYSPYLQGVITVFMICFGINFYIYYMIFVARKPKLALKSEELRAYLIVVAAAILIITLNLWKNGASVFTNFRNAAFQVASIITTTGYSTVDFNAWPSTSKTVLVLLMFVGACAGSTGGGIKVSRLVILAKTVKKQLAFYIHPRSVQKIRTDGRLVEHEVVRSVNVFFVSYIVIFGLSVLLISIDNFDFTTNFTAVAATLNNIGPGLEAVGPTQNFGLFSNLSKFVLMFDMLAGRLEIFPMLLLFAPPTWRK